MKLKVGTRGSKLGLVQTNLVTTALREAHSGAQLEEVVIKTQGDRKQGTEEAKNGDKRDWIHELELALLDGTIHFAVHSGKDVPIDFSEETELISVLRRANPADLFIGMIDSNSGRRLLFEDLPEGAVIGTSSLRRQAQLLRLRPDLRIVEHRGNVPTRLRKLEESDILHGIVLASAGVERLGMDDLDGEQFSSSDVMPAINQGILVVQVARARDDVKDLISTIVDRETSYCFAAERACVKQLNADCHSAVAIFAELSGDMLQLSTRVLAPDGSECIEKREAGTGEDAEQLGTSVGKRLLASGAGALLSASTKQQAGYC